MKAIRFLVLFSLFFLLIASWGLSQQRVSGVVIAADDDEPVIGAAIVVKGNPSIGAATDLDGKFELNLPEGTKTLLVSYIGMKTLEVQVKPRMEIVLQTDAQRSEERRVGKECRSRWSPYH